MGTSVPLARCEGLERRAPLVARKIREPRQAVAWVVDAVGAGLAWRVGAWWVLGVGQCLRLRSG
jgi:hypothetical protein